MGHRWAMTTTTAIRSPAPETKETRHAVFANRLALAATPGRPT
jgi:hypothetical protein